MGEYEVVSYTVYIVRSTYVQFSTGSSKVVSSSIVRSSSRYVVVPQYHPTTVVRSTGSR